MTRLFWAVAIFGGLLPGLWACARAPYQYQPTTAPPVASADAVPQLLFLSFRMTAAPRKLELLQATAVKGQVAVEVETVGRDYLTITQLDARQQPCGAATQVPHPLLTTIEYPAETAGALEQRTAALPSAEFFVRLARQPAAMAVRVTEVAAGVSSPLSIVFPLTIPKP